MCKSQGAKGRIRSKIVTTRFLLEAFRFMALQRPRFKPHSVFAGKNGFGRGRFLRLKNAQLKGCMQLFEWFVFWLYSCISTKEPNNKNITFLLGEKENLYILGMLRLLFCQHTTPRFASNDFSANPSMSRRSWGILEYLGRILIPNTCGRFCQAVEGNNKITWHVRSNWTIYMYI